MVNREMRAAAKPRSSRRNSTSSWLLGAPIADAQKRAAPIAQNRRAWPRTTVASRWGRVNRWLSGRWRRTRTSTGSPSSGIR